MNVNFGLLVVMSLIAYRATWFVVRDSFPGVRHLRNWIAAKHVHSSHEVSVWDADGEEYVELESRWRWAADLITCHWCVSVWASAGVTLLTNATIGLAAPWLYFGATAALSATIAQMVAAIADRE